MEIVSFTEARNNLKSVLDKVIDDSMPTVIFRHSGESVVVVPKSTYDSLRSTQDSYRSLISPPTRNESSGDKKVIPWGDDEIRIVFFECDFPEITMNFGSFPEIGDSVLHDLFGAFRVIERGYCSSRLDQPKRFLIVEQVAKMSEISQSRFGYFYENK